jgi:hypothetical protein
MRCSESELPQPAQGVLKALGMDDPALPQSEDGNLIDALEATPGRGMPKPLPQVAGRAGEPADDLVAFGDQLDDLHVDVVLARAGCVHDHGHPDQAQRGPEQVEAVGPETIE